MLNRSFDALLINGDNLEVMPEMDELVSAIVTDIPYGNPGIVMDSDKRVTDFDEEWDVFDLRWVKPACRLLKVSGAFWSFVPYEEGSSILRPLREEGVRFKRPIFCRIKATATYPRNRKNFASIVETAVFCRKDRDKKSIASWNTNDFLNNDWTDEGHTVDRKRVHKAQKSVSVFKRMIELTTQPGDLILDLFAGSGVSGVAALECGRRWVGIEKDMSQCVDAWKLLREVPGKSLDYLVWDLRC